MASHKRQIWSTGFRFPTAAQRDCQRYRKLSSQASLYNTSMKCQRKAGFPYKRFLAYCAKWFDEREAYKDDGLLFDFAPGDSFRGAGGCTEGTLTLLPIGTDDFIRASIINRRCLH
mmetsp:Transcript_30736/g.73773  ORF Transcript_30736/g.73773 Transcript_30736/m.73773 type:complete len:116 (+) Transcript_30736:379-726(+)